MMKIIRRFVSLLLSLLIILFSSKAFAVSEERVTDNTVSYDQFFAELSEMIDEAESEDFGAMGFGDYSNRIVVKTDSNNKIERMPLILLKDLIVGIFFNMKMLLIQKPQLSIMRVCQM